MDGSDANRSSHRAMGDFVSMWQDDKFWKRDASSDELEFFDLEKIWELFGEAAEQAVNSLSANDKQEICGMLFDMIAYVVTEGEGSGDLREDVRKLLEE
jgi:hypothetical protein